jgi:hypothetical protein
MSAPAADCLAALEAARAGGPLPDLAAVPPAAMEDALRALGREHGAGAVPLLTRLADSGAKAVRKAARRELYRLAQAGLAAPAPAAPAAPLVRREAMRAVEAWASGIDGSGSRALWVLVEGGLGGGLGLCSLIVNDQTGIAEAGGGPTTRKRYEAQLRQLRDEAGGLPWAPTTPAHAAALVREALERHRAAGTAPPAGFAPWREALAELSAGAPAGEEAPAPGPPEAAAVEAALPLLERPELQGWFVDPALLQEDALALLEARDSRLVVPDRVKAERESAILARAMERQLTAEARARWARRFVEMARLYRARGEDEAAGQADTAAAAIREPGRGPEADPLGRLLVSRGLELAGEVALGRARLSDVTRAPGRP